MTDNAFEVETRPGSFLVPRYLGKERGTRKLPGRVSSFHVL